MKLKHRKDDNLELRTAEFSLGNLKSISYPLGNWHCETNYLLAEDGRGINLNAGVVDLTNRFGIRDETATTLTFSWDEKINISPAERSPIEMCRNIIKVFAFRPKFHVLAIVNGIPRLTLSDKHRETP